MNPATTAKILARYQSGLLTAPEVANKLLYDLVSDPEIDMTFLSSVGSLPDAVKQELVDLMRQIEAAGFQWTPFLLTAPPNCADTASYSETLRHISRFLR
jgi:hypothetical protein